MARYVEGKTRVSRAVGALCILAAVLMLFFGRWVQVEGLNEDDLQGAVQSMTESVEEWKEWAVARLPEPEVKADLKLNQLPYENTSVEMFFRDTGRMITKTLDREISMQELFLLTWRVPGYMGILDNLLSTQVLDRALRNSTNSDRTVQKNVKAGLVETVDVLYEIDWVFYVVTGLFLLLGALALWAFIGNLCNRARWGKYVLLVLVALLVIGSYIAVPIVSDLLSDLTAGLEFAYGEPEAETALDLSGLGLQMTMMPAVGLFLLLVPVGLDMIFERKRGVPPWLKQKK